MDMDTRVTGRYRLFRLACWAATRRALLVKLDMAVKHSRRSGIKGALSTWAAWSVNAAAAERWAEYGYLTHRRTAAAALISRLSALLAGA